MVIGGVYFLMAKKYLKNYKMNRKNQIPSDDWRRQGQEKFLRGNKLVFSNYKPYRLGWEHDHCEFCENKFSLRKEDLSIGYSTLDGNHWICIPCFNDFKDEFNWSVYNSDNN